VAQGDDWVDARGAARRDDASRDGDQKQEGSHAHKRHRIAGRNPEKQRAHQAGKQQTGHDSDAYTCTRHQDAFAKHQTQNVGALRAHSYPNADFAGALQDRVGNRAL
jgi:hypothetical protein